MRCSQSTRVCASNWSATTRLETKAATEALAQAWGGREAFKDNLREIKAFLGDETRVSPALAARIADARSPSGGRLVNDPEFAQLLLQVARGQPGRQDYTNHPAPTGGRAMLQAELAELHALRDRDISEYWRPWRKPARAARTARLRSRADLATKVPPDPARADLRAEQRELEQLKARDFDVFSSGAGAAPVVRRPIACRPQAGGADHGDDDHRGAAQRETRTATLVPSATIIPARGRNLPGRGRQRSRRGTPFGGSARASRSGGRSSSRSRPGPAGPKPGDFIRCIAEDRTRSTRSL